MLMNIGPDPPTLQTDRQTDGQHHAIAISRFALCNADGSGPHRLEILETNCADN